MRNLCFALAQVSIYHCTRALSFNSSMLSSKYNDGCCTLRFSLSSAESDITDTGNALPNSLSPLSLNSLERSCFCSSLRASAASQRYLRSSAANPKRWVHAAAVVVVNMVFFIFTFLLFSCAKHHNIFYFVVLFPHAECILCKHLLRLVCLNKVYSFCSRTVAERSHHRTCSFPPNALSNPTNSV